MFNLHLLEYIAKHYQDVNIMKFPRCGIYEKNTLQSFMKIKINHFK